MKHTYVVVVALAAVVAEAKWNDVDLRDVKPVQKEVRSVPGKAASLLPPGKRWKLVWNDEFDQKEIDKSKWMCREAFWGRDFPAFAHNFEGVEMTGETVKLNLFCKNGQFSSPHLQTGSLTYDIPKDSKGLWPFGRYRKALFMHRYGYYEIRCKQPKHPGWHSAFWLQAPGIGSCEDPGLCGVETDIMENYRQHADGKIVGGNGWNGYGKDSKWFGHFAWTYETMPDGWCYYGVDWSPKGYTFYANGKKIGEQNEPVSHVPQFILVSTEPRGYRNAPGNDGGLTAGQTTWGAPDPRLLEIPNASDTFEVDFVRVYDSVPLLVAHRGAADLTMPEASLAAYSNAVEQAMDIVKLDVQATKDGVVVLGHDVTLKRNMGWDAKVCDLTYAEILEKGVYLPMGGVTNARIVRLDEALAIVKSVPGFWIDFKAFSPALAEKVLSTFAEAGIAEERIMVATFAYAALDYMKAKHPNVRRIAHVGGKAPTAQMVEELRQKHGLWGVNLPHHSMARSEVERVIASKSLWVSLWFVQDSETARRWQDVGANAFVTDHASNIRE